MPDSEERRTRLTRRDVLRRGALVGGGLLWAAPVIQSIRTPAYAGSPDYEACCQCANPPPFPAVFRGFTCSDCAQYCAGHGGVKVYTRGVGCLARDRACVPNDSCRKLPCAWESNGSERLRKVNP
jgi:hypothetical protein